MGSISPFLTPFSRLTCWRTNGFAYSKDYLIGIHYMRTCVRYLGNVTTFCV
jgi:hypothetical protein